MVLIAVQTHRKFIGWFTSCGYAADTGVDNNTYDPSTAGYGSAIVSATSCIWANLMVVRIQLPLQLTFN